MYTFEAWEQVTNVTNVLIRCRYHPFCFDFRVIRWVLMWFSIVLESHNIFHFRSVVQRTLHFSLMIISLITLIIFIDIINYCINIFYLIVINTGGNSIVIIYQFLLFIFTVFNNIDSKHVHLIISHECFIINSYTY